MVSRVKLLKDKGLIQPPKWLPANVHYEVIMGSVAYGVSSDTSDMDVMGFCIPTKELVFPHLGGEIPGFGTQVKRFEQYQQHHVMDKETRQEYDLTIYSIVKYFQLCMENNPNMCDSLFVPQRCVLYASTVGQMVRDSRRMFLHKGSYHKFRGYAYAQLHKIGTKANSQNPKRQASIEEFGYDVKFAYHVVRLALEAQQILTEHDLDVEANREILKSVRRGEWSLEKLKNWFDQKESQLEELYISSTLRNKPDEAAIKELLMNCLEQHYGTISKYLQSETPNGRLLDELQNMIDKYR